MISEFDFNYCPLQLYDLQYPTNQCMQNEGLIENDLSVKKLRVSSQCLILKKKIRRHPKRPSVLKIDETARNVKIYSFSPSLTNLDIQDDESREIIE